MGPKNRQPDPVGGDSLFQPHFKAALIVVGNLDIFHLGPILPKGQFKIPDQGRRRSRIFPGKLIIGKAWRQLFGQIRVEEDLYLRG